MWGIIYVIGVAVVYLVFLILNIKNYNTLILRSTQFELIVSAILWPFTLCYALAVVIAERRYRR